MYIVSKFILKVHLGGTHLASKETLRNWIQLDADLAIPVTVVRLFVLLLLLLLNLLRFCAIGDFGMLLSI